MDAIERAVCVYEAILADVSASYGERGGGGISGITQNSSTSFSVKLPQEGRTDVLTYEVEIGANGAVKIVSRTESTQSH